jgi:hypothetical protein
VLVIRARKAPSIAAYTYYPLESTADVLLTKPPMFVSGAFPFYEFCRQNMEPTSGLEPLTYPHYECATRHLGATEGLITSRTATLSPNTSTGATLNRLLVIAPTHRCRKIRIAPPLFFRHAPLPVAESHPGSVRRET